MPTSEAAIKMGVTDRVEAARRVAIASPEKLKEWLSASGRSWLIFNGPQLIDSLPWPEGVNVFMQLVDAYRDHRRALPTGESETISGVKVACYHDDTLTLPELDRCIRFLVGQATALDPTWSLEKDPA